MKFIIIFLLFSGWFFNSYSQETELEIQKIKSKTQKKCLGEMSPCGGYVCGFIQQNKFVYIESIFNGEYDKAVTLFFVQNDKLQKIERYYFHDKKNKKITNNINFEKISFGKDVAILTKKNGIVQKLTKNQVGEIEDELISCYHEIMTMLK